MIKTKNYLYLLIAPALLVGVMLIGGQQAVVAVCDTSGSIGSISGSVQVPASGEYAVWARVNQEAPQQSAISVQVEGSECYDFGSPSDSVNQWQWVRSSGPGETHTFGSSGGKTIDIYGKAEGAKIDRIMFIGVGESCSTNGSIPSGDGSNCESGATLVVDDNSGAVIPPTVAENSENVERVEYYIDGELVQESNDATSFGAASLSAGNYELTSRVFLRDGSVQETTQNLTVVGDEGFIGGVKSFVSENKVLIIVAASIASIVGLIGAVLTYRRFRHHTAHADVHRTANPSVSAPMVVSPSEKAAKKTLVDHHSSLANIHNAAMKSFLAMLLLGLFGSTTSALIANAQSARKFASFEIENSSSQDNIDVVIDGSVSGSRYVRFKKRQPTPSPNPGSGSSGGGSNNNGGSNDSGGGTSSPPTIVRRFPGDPNPTRYDKSYWGAAIEGNGDPVPRHEQPTGSSLSVRRTFYQWNHGTNPNSFLYSNMRRDIDNNRLPSISFKTPGWKAMADGDYDAELDGILQRLDAYGSPIWISFHHEPEGGGGNNFPDDPGGAAEWRRMQQKIRDRMNALNTQNLAFMPILMSYTWNPISNRNPNDWWVPGVWDAYCVDHYQGSESANGMVTDVWLDFVSWVEARNLPYCVGEWGNRGTNATAAQEMSDFWNWSFSNNKDLIAYMYFDSSLNSPGGAWTLSNQTLSAFQDILGNDARVQRVNDL